VNYSNLRVSAIFCDFSKLESSQRSQPAQYWPLHRRYCTSSRLSACRNWPPTGYRYSPRTLPRSNLARDLIVLDRSRFSLEALVGRVGRRLLGDTRLFLKTSANFLTAVWRLASWDRCSCDLIIKTPSLVRRWSMMLSNLRLAGSGREDRDTSKLSCMAVATLLTFCPPGPCEWIALVSISDRGTEIPPDSFRELFVSLLISLAH